MGALETFERKGLFRFTRFVGMFIVCVLIVGFIVGAVLFTGTLITRADTHVKPQTVIGDVRPPAMSQDFSQSSITGVQQDPNFLPGIRLPFVLQPYFSDPNNRRVLLARVEDLTQDEKQEYVDNLAEVVEEAKAQKVDVTEAINAYFREKSEAISRASVKKTALVQTRLYIAGAAVSILGLIALFSLILVLLAIERNTRGARVLSAGASS